MDRFRLEVTLRCPGIFTGFYTLESLLAAAVHEQTGRERESALELVPLQQSDGIWQASAMYFDGFSGYEDQIVVRARRRSEMGPDYYEGRPRVSKNGPWFVEQGSGDFKVLFNTYKTVLCRRLVWFAQGDADRCQNLFCSLQSIGKRRGQGFGEIDDVVVFSTDESPVLDAGGLVRRPVPLDRLKKIPNAAHQDHQSTDVVPWKHPFWEGPSVICAVPVNQVLESQPVQTPMTHEEFFA